MTAWKKDELARLGKAEEVDIAPTLGRLLGVTPLSLIDGRALTDALAPRN